MNCLCVACDNGRTFISKGNKMIDQIDRNLHGKHLSYRSDAISFAPFSADSRSSRLIASLISCQQQVVHSCSFPAAGQKSPPATARVSTACYARLPNAREVGRRSDHDQLTVRSSAGISSHVRVRAMPSSTLFKSRGLPCTSPKHVHPRPQSY